MRTLLGLLLGVVLTGFSATGCGPSAPAEDLGTVVFDVQDWPGVDHVYRLPDEAKAPSADPEEGLTHEAHPHE